MTSDLITFFHPDGSTGQDCVFSLQLDGGDQFEFWVFDRSGKINFSGFASRKISSKEDLEDLASEIGSLIQRGGGLYFYAMDHNGVLRGRLVPIPASDYAPPEEVLRLSPSSGTRFEKITGKIDLAIGDHLVVPVSATAGQRLDAFYKNLECFPSDLQTLLLNVIRRPSLEWRIHRIERALKSLPPATQAAQQKERGQRDFLGRLHHAVMRPIPLGPAIAVMLLVASTVGAYERYRIHTKNAAETEITTGDVHSKIDDKKDNKKKKEGPNQRAESPLGAMPKDGSNPESPESSLRVLSLALQSSSNGDLKKIYENHFKNQPAKSRKIGLGLAKLQAFQLGLIPPNAPILSISDNATAVVNLYRSKALEAVKRNDDSFALLTWNCCYHFNGTAIPETASAPALSLGVTGDCKDLELDRTVPALKTLTDWVKTQR